MFNRKSNHSLLGLALLLIGALMYFIAVATNPAFSNIITY
jgi:hypothetical protein